MSFEAGARRHKSSMSPPQTPVDRFPSSQSPFPRPTIEPACHNEWPYGRFQCFKSCIDSTDKGVSPWLLHAISVANGANQAITSVMPITRPSGSSSPTSNRSERWSTVSPNAFGFAHGACVAAKSKRPFSRLLKKSASGVLASFRPSTYRKGTPRPFTRYGLAERPF